MYTKELVNEFLEYIKTENENERGFEYFYIFIQHPDLSLSFLEIQVDDLTEGNIKLLESGMTIDDTYVYGHYFALVYSSIFFLTTDFEAVRDQFGFPKEEMEEVT